MKKNTMMRIASVLLIAVLVTTCAISGTFAKYVSTATGESTARVAKWAFNADGAEINLKTTKTFTFDVFGTVNDTNGSDETDVAESGTENIIAPGTQGSASVVLSNAGEVNATYAVSFTASEAGVPLQWSTDGSEWEDNIGDLSLNGALNYEDPNQEATITIHWRWAIGASEAVDDATNMADTGLGIDGVAEPTFTATVTITQKD